MTQDSDTGANSAKIAGKVWARIVFGSFAGVPGKSKAFIWVTDHSVALTFGSGANGSGGLVI